MPSIRYEDIDPLVFKGNFRSKKEDLSRLCWPIANQASNNWPYSVIEQMCQTALHLLMEQLGLFEEHEENYYAGHKKTHCVRYRAVVSSSGLTWSVFGAHQGWQHNAGILRQISLYGQLEKIKIST